MPPPAGRARQLTIVGVGLIGGSLGLALRQARLGYAVVGHDREHSEAGKAKRLGAVDRTEWNLPAAVEAADVVVVATPVQAIEHVFRDLAPYLKPGCVVTDTASTKARVVDWAEEILPASVRFVGGHPMAGKETSGVGAAEAKLFQGATWCLCPGSSADQAAIEEVASIARAAGARPFFVDPAEHDSYVAAVSHLPFLMSVGLVRLASESPIWRDLARVASSGFRDATRLASGDPVMHRDICVTNRESILRWIAAYQAELSELAEAIGGDGADLERAFSEAKAARDDWVEARKRRAETT